MNRYQFFRSIAYVQVYFFVDKWHPMPNSLLLLVLHLFPLLSRGIQLGKTGHWGQGVTTSKIDEWVGPLEQATSDELRLGHNPTKHWGFTQSYNCLSKLLYNNIKHLGFY